MDLCAASWHLQSTSATQEELREYGLGIALHTHAEEGVFDLATKKDNDAPSSKKRNLTLGLSAYQTPKVSDNAQAQNLPLRNASSSTGGLLKLAHMAHAHNAQLVKLVKVIPSMI
ncbi:hypothetical protein HAX54_047755 [Datura stramonium]|uniref:Uncharacterized protein n=1 Tax=Datura stramonium TaxID=4076 RepID=A0ABS8WIK8_DATST|nr:hypothetical protein [Datura stramonium]